MCAEAQDCSGEPILVVAISDAIISWKDYAEHFPAPPTTTSAVPLKTIGHFHGLVKKEATSKVEAVYL